ncbi:MAG: hypothetical protein IVW57_15845 [Ktedonobacterales bacterium]|nr:hypothetical protein [Ktedonobacterales bacterium]
MLSLIATSTGHIVFAAHHLPLPPAGVNHQYVWNALKRRVVLNPDLARYGARELQPLLHSAWSVIRANHQDALASAQQRAADLHVSIQWRLPRRMLYRRDLDGLGKYPLDCVCGFLGLTDARIVELHQSKAAAESRVREGFDITIVALHVPREGGAA